MGTAPLMVFLALSQVAMVFLVSFGWGVASCAPDEIRRIGEMIVG
jgi:hypothetical protein